MLYSIHDKFIVDGVLCEVLYINNNMAWVFPLDDGFNEKNQRVLQKVSFNVLDDKGYDKAGKKAIVVNNMQSGAV